MTDTYTPDPLPAARLLRAAAEDAKQVLNYMPVDAGHNLRMATQQAITNITHALQAAERAGIDRAERIDGTAPSTSFQARVMPWLLACFGPAIAGDRVERNHRFLEEALELVQSEGCTEDDAYQLVAYVYGRPAGDPPQEVGGVMVTLAALCLANRLDMHAAAETELARIWTKVEQIRAKQAAKPKFSALPQ
jgi:hypothetical protein